MNLRLNIYGSRIKKGIYYDRTCAPVASCNSIKLLIALLLVHKWKTVQLDYVLEFPQAPVQKELYMKKPKGFEIDTKGDITENVL